MATLSTDRGGSRMIQFVDKNGKRRSLRLGKLDLEGAEKIRGHISSLVAASIAGTSPSKDAAAWLKDCGEEMASRLARVGLAPVKIVGTLSGFVAHFLKKYEGEKPNTRKSITRGMNLLLDRFGPDIRLADITADDADAYARSLRSRFAGSTAARDIKSAKQLFNAAIRARLITESPFDEVKPGSMANPDRFYFVSREDAEAVLAACPSAEWKAIFALARWGGIRVPSELMTLRWQDLGWQRGRMRIHAPKTEHHENRGVRWCPLFPEVQGPLRAYLAESTGQGFIFSRRRSHSTNLHTMFQRIIYNAGLSPWPKLFTNMRSTRETELIQEGYPVHVVAAWLGNTPKIALKHYAQVTEADFERALQGRCAGAVKSAALQSPDAAENAYKTGEKEVVLAGEYPRQESDKPSEILQFPANEPDPAATLIEQVIQAILPTLREEIRAALYPEQRAAG